MFNDFIELVDTQLDSSQREIADVRSILVDAVARLIRDGFGRTECRLPESAIGAESVTALQFQDLSDQLLAHASTRLDALRVEVRRIRCELEARQVTDDARNWQSFAMSAQRNLATFAERRMRPVAAAHLEPGSIELF
jgi:hypothetical protein